MRMKRPSAAPSAKAKVPGDTAEMPSEEKIPETAVAAPATPAAVVPEPKEATSAPAQKLANGVQIRGAGRCVKGWTLFSNGKNWLKIAKRGK